MVKIFYFVRAVVRQSKEDEILPLAYELTCRLLIALFPFIIFLMTLVGFLNLNTGDVIYIFRDIFPAEMMDIVSGFVTEVVETRRTGLLSFSLLAAVYSASSGFKAVIRGINRAHNTVETRKFIHAWVVRTFLVFTLAFAVITSVALLVFGDALHGLFIGHFGVSRPVAYLFKLAGDLVLLLILLFTIVCIYKFGSCKKLSIAQVLPGSLVTLIVWIGASHGFNIYINNFNNLSVVYGSIAGVFITMIWVIIVSFVILVGAEINSLMVIGDE
jgi:membrane protein